MREAWIEFRMLVAATLLEWAANAAFADTAAPAAQTTEAHDDGR